MWKGREKIPDRILHWARLQHPSSLSLSNVLLRQVLQPGGGSAPTGASWLRAGPATEKLGGRDTRALLEMMTQEEVNWPD